MLNDIDTTGLSDMRDALAERPEEGLATYGVELAWRTGVCADVSTLPMSVGRKEIPRDFSWVVDEPPDLLGQSSGPTPQELLMSGVGACIMVGFVVNASVKGVRIKRLNVTVRGSLDLAGFLNVRDDARIAMQGLDYRIRVACDTDESQLKEIEQAAVNFSPNAMTVTHGVPLTGEVLLEA